MSEGNVEIVRAAIDAANRRDWDAVFKDCAPGFEWDNSRAMGPDNRAVFDVDGARDFFSGALGLFDSAEIKIEETIPVGDHVVVPHSVDIRGRDGIEVRVVTTWLFTLNDGKIERVCLYQDTREAMEAAEL
jgi:ketosteroid isomerase-like protein